MEIICPCAPHGTAGTDSSNHCDPRHLVEAIGHIHANIKFRQKQKSCFYCIRPIKTHNF